MQKLPYFLSQAKSQWILEHICDVRGVAADFDGTILLSKHERYYDLGMYALVIVCSRNMNVIMVWAWMLW